MSTSLQQIVREKINVLSEEELDRVLKFLDTIHRENSNNEGGSISDRFDAIRASIPELDWADKPIDGAENHDHYLYGSPRKPR